MFRTATLLGAVMYVFFAGLDYFLHPEAFTRLAVVRLGVVTPILLLAWGWARRKQIEAHQLQNVAVATLLIALVGNFLMANLAELVHFYLVSITIVVLFLGYTITGIRFSRLLFFGIGIPIAFQFYGLQVLHVDLIELGYEDIILFSVNGVGLLAAYVIEKNKRQQFMSQMLVEEQKGEIEQQNEEIRQQNEEIHTQKENLQQKHLLLDKRNRQVMSSITYAKRIQQALLPEHAHIRAHLPEFFAFFRPKDVVSGDFYWFSKQGRFLFIAVADCTGHGVPGGFMTMIGNMLLNQVVDELGSRDPADILHGVDNGLQRTLHRKEVDNKKVSDGMDMAVCRFDTQSRELIFAGAKRPLWFVRNGKLCERRGDRHPIGSWGSAQKQFSDQVIALEAGDMVYLSSDGFIDQFGGESNSKFTKKRLRNHCQELSKLPAEEQEAHFAEIFDDWGRLQKQTDDVLLLGFRIP